MAQYLAINITRLALTSLGEGWNHVVQGGRVVKATAIPPNKPHPNPPHQVTKAPSKPSDRHQGDGQA